MPARALTNPALAPGGHCGNRIADDRQVMALPPEHPTRLQHPHSPRCARVR